MAFEVDYDKTKQQLQHVGEFATGKTDGSPTGTDIDETTLTYTGQVRKTIPKIISDAEANIATAISDAGLTPLGDGVYAAGKTYTAYNQYLIYTTGGSKWLVKSTVDLTSGYTTTEADPNDDTNLRLFNEIDEKKATSIIYNTTSDDVALIYVGNVLTGEHYFRDVANEKTFYYEDGLAGTVSAYDYDSKTITIASTDYTLTDADTSISIIEDLNQAVTDAESAASTATTAATTATSEADRAETAAAAATTNANIYADTSAGLTATSDGDYFSVPSSVDYGYLDLYLNVSSTTATFVKRYPSSTKVEELSKTANQVVGKTGGVIDLTDGDSIVALDNNSEKALSYNVQNKGEIATVDTSTLVPTFNFKSVTAEKHEVESAVGETNSEYIHELPQSTAALHYGDANGGFITVDTENSVIKTSYAIETNKSSTLINKSDETPVISTDVTDSAYVLSGRLYQATPSVTYVNGRHWLVWRADSTSAGENTGNYFVIGYSDDNGATVTETHIVHYDTDTHQLIDPMLWTDPDGYVWLLFMAMNGETDTNTDGVGQMWAATMKNPNAEFFSWSKPFLLNNWGDPRVPKPVNETMWIPVDYWRATAEGLPAYPELAGCTLCEFKWRERELRKLVRLPANYESATAYSGFFETDIAQLSDGSFRAIQRHPTLNLATSLSDDGETWDAWSEYTVLGDVSQSRSWMGILPSGRLAIVYNNSTTRLDLTLVISDDDGVTFPYSVVLEPDDSYQATYPILAVNGDEILVTYDYGRTSAAQIRTSYVLESEVIAGTSSPVVTTISDPTA